MPIFIKVFAAGQTKVSTVYIELTKKDPHKTKPRNEISFNGIMISNLQSTLIFHLHLHLSLFLSLCLSKQK